MRDQRNEATKLYTLKKILIAEASNNVRLFFYFFFHADCIGLRTSRDRSNVKKTFFILPQHSELCAWDSCVFIRDIRVHVQYSLHVYRSSYVLCRMVVLV